jgi:tryptophan halogenase
MSIPDSLAHQIEVFRHNGRVVILDRDSFSEDSWLSLFLGLGLQPQGLDPLLAQVGEAPLRTHFQRLHAAIARTVDDMPDHAAYLSRLVGAV